MPITKLKNGQLPDTISSKTVDNTNDINTTTTRLKITGGSNGQVLSTDGSGNLSWTTAGALGAPTAVVTKTADESVTSSTTLQDDDELFYALTANKTYFIELRLIFARANSFTSQTVKLSVDAASSGLLVAPSYAAAVLCDGTSNLSIPPANAPAGYRLPSINVISVRPSSNTTLQVKWAQLSSNTNTVTVYAGSQLVIWEVA